MPDDPDSPWGCRHCSPIPAPFLWLFAKCLLLSLWVNLPEIRISDRVEKERSFSEMFAVKGEQERSKILTHYLNATFTQI